MKEYSKSASKILAMLPIIIVALLCAWFCYDTVWYGDAIFYGFFVPENPDITSYNRVETFGQLWQSQINHYHTTNGRFFCHIFVQFFCSLLPKFWFAIANGIVSFLFMLLLSRFASKSVENCLIRNTLAATLFWLAGWWFLFDPPFLINYVWMGAISFAWIYVFFNRTNFTTWWGMALWTILSFLAGEGNESFSIPIGAAIIIWFIRCRGRFNRLQWFGAVAYGIGGLVLCLAPGNFVRVDELTVLASQPSILYYLGYTLESLLPTLIVPTLFLFLLIFNCKFRTNLLQSNNLTRFLLMIIAASIILNLILTVKGFLCAPRMTYIDNIALIIIMLGNFSFLKSKSSVIVLVASIICVPLTATSTQNALTPLNNKLNIVGKKYHESESGVVVLPDSLYALNEDSFRLYYIYWVQWERSLNPGKPRIKIYPETLTKIDFEADTNFCVQFLDQGWIIVQSKNHPADFYIDKVLLPGFVNKKMSSRKINISPDSEAFLDSTANTTVSIYINQRPFIESAVTMRMPNE